MKLQNYFAPIKRLLPQAIWRPARALATGIITPIRFSRNTGHWKSSIRMSACTADGKCIPWYTYPAIDFLTQRAFEGRNILEFGGGQSTLWWSKRAQGVLTIEENSDWYERLRCQIGSNVTLHYCPADRVTRTITPIKNLIDAYPIRAFDVIIVDGHLRRELTALAFSYMSPEGAILLDNSEGFGYEQTKNRNCRRIDFYGFAPGVSLRHCTSLVYLGDCFLLQPDIPIADIEMIYSR
jgi:hypothetical protein